MEMAHEEMAADARVGRVLNDGSATKVGRSGTDSVAPSPIDGVWAWDSPDVRFVDWSVGSAIYHSREARGDGKLAWSDHLPMIVRLEVASGTFQGGCQFGGHTEGFDMLKEGVWVEQTNAVAVAVEQRLADACIHPGEGAGKLSRVVHAMLCHAADSAGALR